MELNAIYIDPDNETPTYVGRVAVDEQGRLTFLSAAHGNDGYLRAVVEDINGHEELNVKIAQPPSAPQGSYCTRAYSRAAPDFVEGLIEYAAMRFGLQLAADATLARQQGDMEQWAL
jgi:hypothetical protein